MYQEQLTHEQAEQLVKKLRAGLLYCPNCRSRLLFYYYTVNGEEFATCPYGCLEGFGY